MPPVPADLVPTARSDRPAVPDAAKLFLYPADDHLRPYEPYVAAVLPGALQLTSERRARLPAEFGPYLGQPHHPLEVGLRLIDWLCATCQPTVPLSVARRAHGRAGMLLWGQYNIRGRVITAAMPFMGMERILTRLPQTLATVTNFGSRWVAPAAPGHWYFGCADDPTPPEYVAGILEALSESTKVADFVVQCTAPSSHERVYEVRWRV
jgi:uncharacterized protein (TIGR02265 family)